MIRLLDKHVAAQIAAGEVVERPLSIVKELTENSIDANSSQITVEIKKGGKEFIRVTDNGCGIKSSEVEIAFLRHATSKLREIEDLDTLISLGFRGEALASIAAVTKTTIITKTEDEKVGTKLVIEGGEIVSKEGIGAQNGTTIIVEDLFYNTPARKKFLKTDRSEALAVTEFVSQIAMAYPNIKVRMINNDNSLFTTSGKGDRLKAIVTITSKDSLNKLISFNYEEKGVTIEGYISNPTESKANKKSQVFFVNGRVINSSVIERGINEGYSSRLFEGRHPICYLFLNVPPDVMDVNIHPNKRQVRFYDERVITEAIKNGIIKALNTKEGIGEIQPKKPLAYTKFEFDNKGSLKEIPPEIHTQMDLASSYDGASKIKDDSFDKIQLSKDDVRIIDDAKSSKDAKDIKEVKNIDEVKILNKANGIKETKIELDSKSLDSNEESKGNTEIPLNLKESSMSTDSLVESKNLLSTYNKVKEIKNTIEESPSTKAVITNNSLPFDVESITPIGQIFGTYIQAVDRDTLYIIDQHAAHERVFFEKFRNEFVNSQVPKQGLLIPFTITLPLTLSKNEDMWIDKVKSLGYEIENFGPNIYRVTEIPMYFDISDAEEFLGDFIEMSMDFKDYLSPKVLDRIATRACKASIKANDHLSSNEITSLLKELNKCENPFSCPHGRPVFIKMTRDEIEKKFKRK